MGNKETIDVNKQLILPTLEASFVHPVVKRLICFVRCCAITFPLNNWRCFSPHAEIFLASKDFQMEEGDVWSLQTYLQDFYRKPKRWLLLCSKQEIWRSKAVLYNNYLSTRTAWHVRSPILLLCYNQSKCPSFTLLHWSCIFISSIITILFHIPTEERLWFLLTRVPQICRKTAWRCMHWSWHFTSLDLK